MQRILRAAFVSLVPVALVGLGAPALVSNGDGEDSGPAAAAPTDLAVDERPGRYPFYWTRAIYSSGSSGGFYGWGRRESWATDFPKSDRQFVTVLKRLVEIDVWDGENAVRLDDPILRHFPLLYMVEVGYMDLGDSEVEGLRSYLEAGGFLIVDDFWGAREWAVFQENMGRVLPDKPIVDLPLEHPIFSTFYDIEEVKQVPARGRGIPGGPPAAECRGCEPTVRGIFDDDGRLMVVINWNTDLGDAWEWAEDPRYPLEYSTYAYQMGANMIVYAMSH
ncbi:MAG: DUF4159 domain-containing protein [Gemmatimonadota bacterium]|nr:DUF4159 domain-containing protein [Gemmatimonadota bacterium]